MSSTHASAWRIWFIRLLAFTVNSRVTRSEASAVKCTRFGGRDGIPNRAEVEKLLSGNPA